MTIHANRRRRTLRTQSAFGRLIEAGFTALGIPASLGGTGGSRDAVLGEVMRLQRSDPAAGAALASHQCVIAALLVGRNVCLRDRRVPALARGKMRGIWPSSAIDDMLHRGTAAVQALESEHGLTLSGPLGRIHFRGSHPILLVCPVQWDAFQSPALALIDGERDGLRFVVPPAAGHGAPDTRLASLDNAVFQAEDLVDEDGSRIVMMAELQALHSTVQSWLERSA